MRPPQSPRIERVTLRHVGTLLLEQFNLEKGFGYTLKGLLLHPGKVLYEYLFEDRKRMVRPLTLLLLVVGATVFLSFRYLALDAELQKSIEQEVWLRQLPESFRSALEQFIVFLQQYFNLAMMSSIPVTALVTYWIFREQRLYYAEHLVLNTYIYSMQSIITLIFLPFLVKVPVLAGVSAFLTVGYMVYAFTKIFEQSWWEGILKTVAVYVSSQFIYYFIVLIILSVIAMIS